MKQRGCGWKRNWAIVQETKLYLEKSILRFFFLNPWQISGKILCSVLGFPCSCKRALLNLDWRGLKTKWDYKTCEIIKCRVCHLDDFLKLWNKNWLFTFQLFSIEKVFFCFFCINGTFKLWGWIVFYGQIPNQQPLSSLEQRLHIYKFLMKSAYEPRWARLSACVNKSIAQVRCCDPHPPTTGTWRRKRRKKKTLRQESRKATELHRKSAAGTCNKVLRRWPTHCCKAVWWISRLGFCM